LDVPSEVIVADDSSTDRTAEIAHQHGARVVTVHHRQISATRNAGAQAAHGDFLIFIDADTLVTPEAVRAAVEAVRSGAVGGGCAIRYSGRIPTYLRVFIPIEVWFARRMRIAFGCFFLRVRHLRPSAGSTRLYATEEVTMSLALHRQGDSFACASVSPLPVESSERIPPSNGSFRFIASPLPVRDTFATVARWVCGMATGGPTLN
jgi:glycosyltransferase involved in cell wall biosynthesis